MTIGQFYESQIKRLSPHDRLRLAGRLINDLAGDSRAVDESDTWSDEDLHDFTRSGQGLIDRRLVESERA